MEDDYSINEIQSFKSHLVNMQKGIRELKNNMTFIEKNQREINSKLNNFTEVDELRGFQRDNFSEEAKQVENSNESYINKIDSYIKEVKVFFNEIKLNLKKFDLENQIHHESYVLKDLKRNNFELEKYRRELESKRLLQQKELVLLKNKAKINQEKRNEVVFTDENAQRKIGNCVKQIEQNNEKLEALRLRFEDLENSISSAKEKKNILNESKGFNYELCENIKDKIAEISQELENNKSQSDLLEKDVSGLRAEINVKNTEANYIANKLNELSEMLKEGIEKVKTSFEFLNRENKELQVSLNAKEKLGGRFKQIESCYDIISSYE